MEIKCTVEELLKMVTEKEVTIRNSVNTYDENKVEQQKIAREQLRKLYKENTPVAGTADVSKS